MVVGISKPILTYRVPAEILWLTICISEPPAIGRRSLVRPSASTSIVGAPIDPYSAWIACNSMNDSRNKHCAKHLRPGRTKLPRISVVMPVYNTPLGLLR